MFVRRLIFGATCAAAVVAGALFAAPSAEAGVLAATAHGSTLAATGTAARPLAEPAHVVRRHPHHRRCWTETWRDRRGHVHHRRICRMW
jgi:hypothetical protein